jgi:hypothetical protein
MYSILAKKKKDFKFEFWFRCHSKFIYGFKIDLGGTGNLCKTKALQRNKFIFAMNS